MSAFYLTRGEKEKWKVLMVHMLKDLEEQFEKEEWRREW